MAICAFSADAPRASSGNSNIVPLPLPAIARARVALSRCETRAALDDWSRKFVGTARLTDAERVELAAAGAARCMFLALAGAH